MADDRASERRDVRPWPGEVVLIEEVVEPVDRVVQREVRVVNVARRILNVEARARRAAARGGALLVAWTAWRSRTVRAATLWVGEVRGTCGGGVRNG